MATILVGMQLSQVRAFSDYVMELIVMVIVALLTGLVPALYFSMRGLLRFVKGRFIKKGQAITLRVCWC